MRRVRTFFAFIFYIYLVPGLAAAGYWATRPHPSNWKQANWSSAHILPDPAKFTPAQVVIFSARTGGFKGAFAVHSWIVVKRENAAAYERYDVVGWGMPVRKNAYVPDSYWYSNMPEVVWEKSGPGAALLIPKIEAAISVYPHNFRGGYTLWPGPNSNTFVATIMRDLPEIDTVLPSNAVGRDYPGNGQMLALDRRNWDARFNLFGLAGISAGWKSGFELQFMGLVAGFDFRHPGIKIPAFGQLGI